MDLLADYCELEEDILLKTFAENVAILPHQVFTEILEHIEMHRDVDEAFLSRMKNSRVELQRKETNKRSYNKNKIETLEKEVHCLQSERNQLAEECDRYRKEIQYYNYQIISLSRNSNQNNEPTFPNYGEFLNTNENYPIGGNARIMNANFCFASDPEFNQQTQYQNRPINHQLENNVTFDLISSFRSLGLGTYIY